MIAQQTTAFFVRFRDKATTGLLFKIEQDYPVFAVDVVDGDNGEKETSFLLADSSGAFQWVKSDHLKRQPPHASKSEGVFRRTI